ncbi:FKBP-type peptidyl-prolyl cis-trans isomerase [Rufibacter roseus]|uniref:Peptidyl-prolyl cis-trans isomerase n=1 Tax=Rufibacter roseus TaxID=1567108 RepID=A0ABW2DKX9_9BACT|nr:FKBP-type peptidyl-prolyl cis-trans isomerase [Rufibacter roseus]
MANGLVVSIRYKMQNSKGEVLEDTTAGDPVEYIHGTGSILPELEANLVGLRVGDKKSVSVSEEQGFVGVDDAFVLDVDVVDMRLATAEELEVGQLIQKVKQQDCGPEGCC